MIDAQPEGPPSGQERTLLRFWSKVDTSAGPDACWPWRGGKRSTKKNRPRKEEYGSFDAGGRTVSAHRFALETKHGPQPSHVLALHSCDFGLCCNPKHLSPGGHGRNLKEAYDRGRRRAVNQHTKRMQTRQVETIDAAA